MIIPINCRRIWVSDKVPSIVPIDYAGVWVVTLTETGPCLNVPLTSVVKVAVLFTLTAKPSRWEGASLREYATYAASGFIPSENFRDRQFNIPVRNG